MRKLWRKTWSSRLGTTHRLVSEPWLWPLGNAPRPWSLAHPDPAARWIVLTGLLDLPSEHPDVAAAHAAVLADPHTTDLLGRLPDWEVTAISGHNQAGFAPNVLGLLADCGVGPGDDPRAETILDAMLRHQEPDGRLASLGCMPKSEELIWGSLPCDTLAILEVLLRFGRGDDIRLPASIERATADLEETPQGPGWRCISHSASGWRGPGRRQDVCPQATMEALRLFSLLPSARRPPALLGAASTLLSVWRNRGSAKPYFFGHGRQFKSVKWPPFWYTALTVLEALSRYPDLWRGPDSRPEDRAAAAELAACLVAYNVGSDGRVVPKSCYRGFETFSFGQKKLPSPFATARLCAVLRRFDELTPAIAAVDVTSLASSKGGTGRALPPR
jgi:hypothetical protein